MIPKTPQSANADELAEIYARRFSRDQTYRNMVWKALISSFFQKYVPDTSAMLDLGCGFAQFINHQETGDGPQSGRRGST